MLITKSRSGRSIPLCSGITGLALATLVSLSATASTVIWNGPATASTANNWSGGNWSPSAPGVNDDVKFFNAGALSGSANISNINNTVDASLTIGSLQYGSTNLFHTTLIASGATLVVTNGVGLLVTTPGDANQGVVTASVVGVTNWATITGAGGALVVTNGLGAGNLVVNGGSISNATARGILNMSGLDTFTANVNRLGLGTTTLPNPGGTAQRNHGILYLAKTNFITINYTDTLANYQTAGKTNAIEISRNPGNNPGATSYLYLGQTNVINVDSLGVGMDKSGNNNTPASGAMQFNPSLAGSSPVAVFRGVAGGSSRVTWWSIGDANASSSSSNGGRGTNDFTLGLIDAMINVLSLGRECDANNTGFAGPDSGVLSFNAGTVDVNTVYAGNQAFNRPASMPGCAGTINVGGPTALLKVNTTLVLGQTTVTYAPAPGQGTNAYRTTGVINGSNGGSIWANTLTVGATSVTNVINLSSATLIVSNTLATNASGLFVLNLANSTLGLTVPANGSLRALVQTLNTVGLTNVIQLDSKPVFFASYPQQFPLVKYSTWTGSNVFGLTNLPGWAIGATLVSNAVNKSLDLSLPSDPRPIFTSQPTPYSGNPGDNVTSSFAVTISAGSVTPLGYQWYFVANNVTNLLTDGSGPSGSSTLSGSTTANLQIANAQAGDSGNYFVVVTNAYGTNTSSLALLTISASAIAPQVTGPATVTATNGITTFIANSVSGSPVPTLYWQYNGAPLSDGAGPSGSSTISGTSGATLTIINPQYPGDQGTYSLIASNSAGLATNNTVLAVIVPPAIATQPASVAVNNGQSASLTVVATGVPAPTYQWFKNGSPISSVLNNTATNATLTIASVSPSDSSTNYYVQISNAAGATNSTFVTLTVNSAGLTVAALAPANSATGVCYDTPLYLTFSQTPTLRALGKIKIYNAASSTLVDTIDLGQCVTANPTYAANIQPYNIGGDVYTNFPVIISGNTAAIYPHHGILTSNQTYYVTVDNGTFTDAAGAYFVGLTNVNAWRFSTKVGGPANVTNLIVAADGGGDFLTVQGAVDSVAANNTTPTVINIRNGFYTEAVDVKSKHNLDFRGQSRNGTLIGYPNNNWVNGNGAPWRSSFIVNGNDCSFENLTITNTTPAGGSQAEAMDVEGTRAIFYNMELDSYQDTFLVHSAGKLVYFQDCLIQGQTDFNWGYGTVYYTNCEIRCLLSGGHVTQPRSPYTTNGFGFINCRITQGYTGSSTFDLGRTIGTPTSPSEALFYNCLMADVVTGYASDAGTNMADYACSNLTASATKTLANSAHSPSNDAFVLAIQSASSWLYNWQPALAPNITTNPLSQSATAGQMVKLIAAATGIPVPAYQWFKNGTNLPGATSGTLNIASAQRSDGGNYYVVASNSSGSVTSSIVALTYNNTAPVAQNFTMGAIVGTPSTVQIVGGKFAPTDADGDSLTVTGVAGATNGIVSTDGSAVTYTATNGAVDSFTYTVSDGFGGTANGIVTVAISSNAQGYNQLSATSLGNGTNVLTFAGIPTYNYALDMTTNLAPPINWLPQATNPAANNGSLIFTNVTSEPQSFYRTRYVP